SEAQFASDAVSFEGKGDRGGGGDHPRVQGRELDYRRGHGEDHREVPPGKSGPSGKGDPVRQGRESTLRADSSSRSGTDHRGCAVRRDLSTDHKRSASVGT